MSLPSPSPSPTAAAADLPEDVYLTCEIEILNSNAMALGQYTLNFRLGIILILTEL